MKGAHLVVRLNVELDLFAGEGADSVSGVRYLHVWQMNWDNNAYLICILARGLCGFVVCCGGGSVGMVVWFGDGVGPSGLMVWSERRFRCRQRGRESLTTCRQTALKAASVQRRGEG